MKTIMVRVFLLLLLFSGISVAADRTVDFTIAYKTINVNGRPAQAIAVNDQIPGPTLHFKEGDHVTINVYNHLDQGTSIHWHGLIVPWKMDGVSEVTQEPIPPGQVFHYQFTLNQSGTYWYHAHKGLQEQRGLYGAFIIDPPKQRYHYNKDFTVVLSDWLNTHPDQIYSNLKKDGDYYGSEFPMQTSLFDFARDYFSAPTSQRHQVLADYNKMQTSRMGLYDISDVAYSNFLLNGQPATHPWQALVKPGDVVRLRLIGAGASTLFQVKIANSKMQVIHVQGNDVKPYTVDHLTIAPGETYDVLVRIEKPQPYIIYAESMDHSGAALGALVTSKDQPVAYKQVSSFPKPQRLVMKMPPKTVAETVTQYQSLESVTKTNVANKPIHTIKIVLTGDMSDYTWFLNGVEEAKAQPIMIEYGQRYRFIFVNKTLMHHPMHLHGHWFILRNGHGEWDPLLHTIDVPPNATVIADVDANESGQWYFHCHNFYHMRAGMANIVRYPLSSADKRLGYLPGHKTIDWYQATHLEIGRDFGHHTNEINFNSLIGPDFNKLQLNMEDAEYHSGKVEAADLDVFYWRQLSQFWAVKGGLNYNYRPAEDPYYQPGIGIEGVTPYFVDTDARLYLHRGSFKLDLDLSRNLHIYRRFFINTEMRTVAATKTVEKDEIGDGLNRIELSVQPQFILSPRLSIYTKYEYTQYFGDLKIQRADDGDSAHEDNFFLGVSILL